MPVIRIDGAVFRELQLRGNALQDTPNTTLRRELKIDTDSAPDGLTLFDLMHTAVSTRGKTADAALREIKRRFYTFGWATPPGRPKGSPRKKATKR